MSKIYEELNEYYKTSNGEIYQIPTDEQESWINVDYENKQVEVYTNRPTCLRNLIRILGTPTDTSVMGGTWYINFNDRYLINRIFTMNLYLPKKNKSKKV